MLTQPRVLLICSDEAESQAIEQSLIEHVELRTVTELSQAERVLEDGRYDAVFCGWSFHKDVCNTVLQQIQQLFVDCPPVIFCGAGGEEKWNEVFEAGGFDWLVAPYQQPAAVPVFEAVAVPSRRLRRSRRHTPQLAGTIS